MRFGLIEEYQGLKFKTDVNAENNIATVIGRNGSGKSRLLQSIAAGKVQVFINDEAIQQGAIRLIRLNELQPNFGNGYDPLKQRHDRSQAVAMYNAFRGDFKLDIKQSSYSLTNGRNPRSHKIREFQIDVNQLIQIVSSACRYLGKDPNGLSNDDISDFFAGYGFSSMGSINVVGIMRAYWDRQEENKFNAFQNAEYGVGATVWSDDEFVKRFGPPPWEVLNEFLRDILDGRYCFEVPTRANIDSYSGSLYRSQDGLVVQPTWLSSGEKVLMWLCLSMYATNSLRSPEPPRLLLLDEPDGTLHPEMVQKLHKVLRSITEKFSTGILFTTHSPTTISLFNAGPVWKISEDSLVEVDKDTAIGELLVGLDQVVVNYSKCRQVYVESHKDEEIYSEIFNYLRIRNVGISEYIALSFIPAAPKLADQNVRDLIKAYLGPLEERRVNEFLKALNGQGNCSRVLGTVESLNVENGFKVCGIIDWDGDNKPQEHIYVLGEGLFDNIESAVLNPLTIGIYLLQHHSHRIKLEEYGLKEGFDFVAVISDVCHWQQIADGVMRRVLGDTEVRHDFKCDFSAGGKVSLDARYTHMDGHMLEGKIKGQSAYPFLNEIRRPTLLMDVITRGIKASGGRTLPSAFPDLFKAIQITG